jgi:signal transduction histidine kinase
MGKLPIPNPSGEQVLEEELAVYRAIRPYIARCLSLNHEINNPLAGIIGYAEFLMEICDSLPPEHRRFVEQIMLSAERIQAITESLCQEKIALNEQVDIRALAKAFEPLAPASD